MSIARNFYAVLGIILVLVFVLGARCGSMKKIGILLAFTLALLWLEKPDWFVLLLWKAGVNP